MADRLIGVQAKIERAKYHIRDLEGRIGAFRTAEADQGRLPHIPCFNAIAGGPSSGAAPLAPRPPAVGRLGKSGAVAHGGRNKRTRRCAAQEASTEWRL